MCLRTKKVPYIPKVYTYHEYRVISYLQVSKKDGIKSTLGTVGESRKDLRRKERVESKDHVAVSRENICYCFHPLVIDARAA